jgi:hypothetical protein
VRPRRTAQAVRSLPAEHSTTLSWSAAPNETWDNPFTTIGCDHLKGVDVKEGAQLSIERIGSDRLRQVMIVAAGDDGGRWCTPRCDLNGGWCTNPRRCWAGYYRASPSDGSVIFFSGTMRTNSGNIDFTFLRLWILQSPANDERTKITTCEAQDRRRITLSNCQNLSDEADRNIYTKYKELFPC